MSPATETVRFDVKPVLTQAAAEGPYSNKWEKGSFITLWRTNPDKSQIRWLYRLVAVVSEVFDLPAVVTEGSCTCPQASTEQLNPRKRSFLRLIGRDSFINNFLEGFVRPLIF